MTKDRPGAEQDGRARRVVPRATLKDVARAAGVSVPVASRALREQYGVAQGTRERVRTLAERLGYRASARAVAMRVGLRASARCAVVAIGLRAEEIGRSFYGPVVSGIAAHAAAEPLEVHLVQVVKEEAKGSARAAALARILAEDRADGLILLTFDDLAPEDVAELDAAGVPYVLVNRHFDHVGGPAVRCVTSNWAGATRDAVEHLAGLGHRRLALALPPARNSTVWDHELGWEEGLRACGLDPADQVVARYPLGAPGRASAQRERLLRALTGTGDGSARSGSSVRVTAVICSNDVRAHRVVRDAQERGLRVPEDLSVIGFDDTIAAFTTPPLCSFDPHAHRLGNAAAKMLGRLMREDAPVQRVTLPLEFRCRESCGPAPPRWAGCRRCLAPAVPETGYDAAIEATSAR